MSDALCMLKRLELSWCIAYERQIRHAEHCATMRWLCANKRSLFANWSRNSSPWYDATD